MKCEDTLGLSTPSWTVDGADDYEDVANVKTVVEDLGMSVLSINWALMDTDVARVKCRAWRTDLRAWRKRCCSSHLVRYVWRPEYQEEEEYLY